MISPKLALLIFAAIIISVHSTGNYILNGDFENPSRNGGKSISTILSWAQTKNQIETGKGTIYNAKWTTGQICELDANSNSAISQAVKLKKGNYTLQFTHASRQGIAQDSNWFSVWWNGKLVALIKPTDYNLRTRRYPLIAVEGRNVLTFKGEGKSDGYGQGIDNVILTKRVNRIINGDFENPSRHGNGGRAISTIPSWTQTKNQIETGNGTIYNGKWATGQICELDAKSNSAISQTVKLPKGIYTLEFSHASRSRIAQDSNQFSVWWNGELVALIKPTDYDIHTRRFTVHSVDGDNVLTFKGEGKSDGYGQGIDNVSLYR